jgi:hypothetical protein
MSKTSLVNIFNNFIDKYNIDTNCNLFDIDDNLNVNTILYGKEKYVLKRSKSMENLIINEVNKTILDYENNTSIYDGLIYMMYKKENNNIVPLYIGKSEKFGKNNKNLSINIKDIEKNSGKFCRWGYNYAYHMGDLSAIVLTGHDETKITNKYTSWANKVFKNIKTNNPQLKTNIYFWIKAWNSNDIGLWEDFGKTSLTFLEYQMIGTCSKLFPNDLLNFEGVNR